MGADPVTAMLIMAGAAEAGQAYFQSKSADSKTAALDLQQKQNTLIYQQKVLSNLDVTEKVLAKQQAEASVRGFAMNSPSFNAIQRETANTGAREGKNLQIEESFADANIRKEKENVKRTLQAQLFGDVANMAFMASGANSKMPKYG